MNKPNKSIFYVLSFFVFISVLSGVSADLATDIVSYWKFDGDATDSVGSNDITITGASNVTGKINNSYDFSFDSNMI